MYPGCTNDYTGDRHELTIYMGAHISSDIFTVPNAMFLGVHRGKMLRTAWIEDLECDSITKLTLEFCTT